MSLATRGETQDMEGEEEGEEIEGHERDQEVVILEMASMSERQARVISLLQAKNQRLEEQRRKDIESVRGLGDILKNELQSIDPPVHEISIGTYKQWCCVGGIAGFIAGALCLWIVNLVVFG